MILHPSEWHRTWNLFFDGLEKDLELRFPETRRRFAIELKQNLQTEDAARYQNVIRRFHSAKRVVSSFDWPLLVEWNERKEQALCVAMIQDHLEVYIESDEEHAELVAKFRRRLQDLKDLVVQHNLPRDPKLWLCLKTRLKLMFVRDEARYLCSRLKANCLKQTDSQSA